jgi:hypothetical protein
MKSTILIPLILVFAIGASQGQSFYKDAALFWMRPNEKK